MFNRDALFGKKEDAPRNEPRSSVNVTPGLGGANPPVRPQPGPEAAKPDLRFADVQKPLVAQAQQQPAQQARAADEPQGSRLIVGPDIKLKGVEITDCDTLVVEGRVEASMDSRVIQIAENGVFSGIVSIDVAEIRGRFEGELTARKQLVIYSTGRVSGHIRYGKIRIEEGGEIAGEVSTLAKAQPSSLTFQPIATASQSTPAAAPAAAATPAAATPATPAGPAPVTSGASAPAARAEQPTGAPAKDQQAAASREPAPSRASNKSGGNRNNAGINTV